MTNKKSSHTGLKVALVGSALAAVAGAYYLYGTKDGIKTKRKIKAWALKAKAEVMEKIEKTKDISESSYNAIVDTVTAKYGKVKDVSVDEVEELSKDLKKHWKNIKKHLA